MHSLLVPAGTGNTTEVNESISFYICRNKQKQKLPLKAHHLIPNGVIVAIISQRAEEANLSYSLNSFWYSKGLIRSMTEFFIELPYWLKRS